MMKTALLSGLAACVLFAIASPSFAGHRRYYQRQGYGRGIRVTSNYNGYGNGYGYGGGFGGVNVPPGLYTAPPFQYRGGYSGYNNGYSYSPPATQWHDTSHYDYHPGYVVPHGDHLDVVPGHYHYHPSGHYDTYYP